MSASVILVAVEIGDRLAAEGWEYRVEIAAKEGERIKIQSNGFVERPSLNEDVDPDEEDD